MKNTSLISDVLDLVTFVVISLVLSILFSGVILVIAALLIGINAFKAYSNYLEQTGQIILDPISEVAEVAKEKIQTVKAKIQDNKESIIDVLVYASPVAFFTSLYFFNPLTVFTVTILLLLAVFCYFLYQISQEASQEDKLKDPGICEPCTMFFNKHIILSNSGQIYKYFSL